MIYYGSGAKTKLKSGINKLVDAVRTTLGPSGCVVVLKDGTVTKDGVTVARSIELTDKAENAGAQIIRQAAQQTADNAGDGSTSAAVIAQALVNEGLGMIDGDGYDAQTLRRELEAARDEALTLVDKMALPVESQKVLEQIAIISANSDIEMGEKVAEAVWEVGKTGVVMIEDGQKFGLENEIVKGSQVDTGYVGPFMATSQSLEAIYEATDSTEIKVLCIDYRLEKFETLLEVLGSLNRNKLVIFARGFSHEVLSGLVMNRLKAGIFTLAIALQKHDSYEILDDIAALTGARVIAERNGLSLEHVTLDHAGKARKILADAKRTIIREGAGEPAEYIGQLRQQLDESQDERRKKRLEHRLARLEGKVAIIRVAAASEAELVEKKYRLDDAVCACKSALEEGIVAGGGSAYTAVAGQIVPATNGSKLLIKALESPLYWIAKNAGAKPDVIVEKVKQGGGYDARARSFEPDMVSKGIIDPAKVVKNAIQNAVSVASMVITASCVLSEDEQNTCSCNSSTPTGCHQNCQK